MIFLNSGFPVQYVTCEYAIDLTQDENAAPLELLVTQTQCGQVAVAFLTATKLLKVIWYILTTVPFI